MYVGMQQGMFCELELDGCFDACPFALLEGANAGLECPPCRLYVPECGVVSHSLV